MGWERMWRSSPKTGRSPTAASCPLSGDPAAIPPQPVAAARSPIQDRLQVLDRLVGFGLLHGGDSRLGGEAGQRVVRDGILHLDAQPGAARFGFGAVGPRAADGSISLEGVAAAGFVG